jgi:hypothetical protein
MTWTRYFKEIFAEPLPPVVAQEQEILRKPRLAAVRSAPSREEFAAWRDHPVTQFVFAAYRAQIETCEQSWLAQSWEGGTADQKTLDDLKARADTYAALEESDYEAFCDACGVEPEPMEQGAWAS